MTDNVSADKEKLFIVTRQAEGERLDAHIAAGMPDHVSRSRIKEIIKQGGVTVNGETGNSPNYRLKQDDEIRLVVPEATDPLPKPEPIPLDIRYEDNELLVVHKPAGLVVHPAVGHWTGTLVNALLYHCGDTLSGIGGVKRPGIVHRIDKDTSGLLVVAKTERAHASLSAQFADHGRTGPLEREYLALVWGIPSPRSDTIETWLARSPTNRIKRTVVSPQHRDAKHAITHYRVSDIYTVEENPGVCASLISCQLETGRTHQIRVHMSHIGHPLIGDREYGSHFMTKTNKLPSKLAVAVSNFKRQALHAAKLGFEHPATGEVMQFEAELPEDFQKLIHMFSK